MSWEKVKKFICDFKFSLFILLVLILIVLFLPINFWPWGSNVFVRDTAYYLLLLILLFAGYEVALIENKRKSN
jgi:hypothetical protein